MASARGANGVYAPYVPRLAQDWDERTPGQAWRALDGSLVFVDISGFTALSERLARRGRQGAEELTDTISSCFAGLLSVAYGAGGSLLKFGGDALLLLFEGADHPTRAVASALQMRARMVELGRVTTSVGNIRLRMSVGVHSGQIHLFRVGQLHRELIVTGPGVSATVEMESTAQAGEIVVSASVADQIDPALVGAAKGPGFLLRNRRLAPLPDTYPELPTASADLTLAIPTALRSHLAGAVEPEHRQATIAFVHFDNIDALIDDAGPAAAAEALDALTSDVQTAAEEEGVTFLASDADHDGGKLILVAGAPRSLGDDEGRTLRALRRIADVERQLPTRFGIHRGHVFVGEVGPDYRRTYTVMGDTVNLAARLMAKASAGEIIATSGVLDASATEFSINPLPPFMVKGKAKPIEAFAVGTRGDARTRDASNELPFLGRAAELAQLEAALDAIRGGQGGVVEVIGEAGIGKSRLIHELLSRDDAPRAVSATCEMYETATPYFAMRYILRGAFGVRPDHQDGVEALRRVVQDAAPELEPWLPLLASVIGLEVDATPATRSLAPQARRDHTRRVVLELLDAAVRVPHAFVIEDAQWVDAASAELLIALAAAATRRPWLICAIRRPEPSAFAPEDDVTLARVNLGPLDDRASRMLIAAGSRKGLLRPDQRDVIVRQAGGNPLFLTGLLTSQDSSVLETALPDSLEALVATQIDRLEDDDRRLLRYAAVLGPIFEIDRLSELVAHDIRRSPAASLRRLRTFLEPMGGGLVRFRNQCYRQVAYDTLSFGRRRELHARAGRAIEALPGRSSSEHAAILSFHFLHARDYERCWTYASTAAAHAVATYANVDAVHLYERALAASTRLDDLVDADVADVWEALGDASLLVGIPQRAKVAFGRARQLCAQDDATAARLCKKEADTAMYSGQQANVMRWANRGLRRLEGAEGSSELSVRASLHLLCGDHHLRMGRYRRAVVECDLAIQDALAADDQRSLARAYTVRDVAALNLGMLDEVTHLPMALSIWEELGSVRDQAVVLTVLGVTAYQAGRWDDAVDLYRRGSEAYLQAGDAITAAYATCNIAEILVDQGRGDEAVDGLHEVLELWRSVRHPGPVGDALVHLGRCALQRGDLTEAIDLFAQASDRAGSVDESTAIAADAFAAECRIHQGEPDLAMAQADSALRRVASTGDTTFIAKLRRVRGYALGVLGRSDEALGELEESLEAARARASLYEEALTLEAVCRLHASTGVGPGVSIDGRSEALLKELGVRSSFAPEIPVVNRS